MSTQPVQIVARIRPPLLNEQTDDAISAVPIPAGHALTAARPIPFTSWVSVSSTGTKTGTTQVQNSQTAFHAAFGPVTTQLELFDTAVAPHLAPLLKGHTLTILAYGPTSSGKTHTMEGSPTEPGIIPRSVKVLFEMSEEGKESGKIIKFDVHMTYLELYKDDAFDLLVSQRTHEKLPIRTNAKGETFVVGLTRIPIRSFDDWKNVFRTASQNRTTGATLLNRASSRSHAMLSIEIELVAAPTSETPYNGKMNLVDLAGSENNKHTGNSLANPTRLAESAAINKSLSTLGQVVHALNTGASRIPYRDSNLTRLLSASLGGKALGKTILLCNLAPGVKFRSDVLNTLNFASRTKNIETKTVVNEREKPAPVENVKELPPVGSLMRRTSIQSRRVSASHIPAPGSRIPSYGAGGHSRLSGFGLGLGGAGMGVGGIAPGRPAGIDDADLNERINKAVEAEVKRRLEEKEAQRRLEDEEREKKLQHAQQQEQKSGKRNISSSSSSLTPFNQETRPTDINMESYETKGAEEDIIEVEVEEAEVETELRVHMNLAERKKMGKIYVDLARGYSAKNDLATALSLYRHAALFVPDNTRLRERIIDVEWAVKNGKSYVPTPKR
ncbi:kinesin-domain-containing protein, partial [Lentinula aciculospora]